MLDRATASAARDHAADARRRALRRLRPAPDLDHVHAAQPVPGRARSAARLPGQPGRSEDHLRSPSGRGSLPGADAVGGSRCRGRRDVDLQPLAPAGASSTAAAGNTGTGIRRGAGGGTVPLGAFTTIRRERAAPINHQGQFPVVTVSFNLAPKARRLGPCARSRRRKRSLGTPGSIQAGFQGTAQARSVRSLHEHAAPDSRGAGHGLHPPRRPLTRATSTRSRFFPHSRRRGRGAARRSCSAGTDFSVIAPHRDHSPDRHRGEERDHDDRLRAGRRAQRKARRRRTRSSRRPRCGSARS